MQSELSLFYRHIGGRRKKLLPPLALFAGWANSLICSFPTCLLGSAKKSPPIPLTPANCVGLGLWTDCICYKRNYWDVKWQCHLPGNPFLSRLWCSNLQAYHSKCQFHCWSIPCLHSPGTDPIWQHRSTTRSSRVLYLQIYFSRADAHTLVISHPDENVWSGHDWPLSIHCLSFK